jgi:lipopolysaccharide/colanic/teichoic acid biosynthesis glycosyltransferase
MTRLVGTRGSAPVLALLLFETTLLSACYFLAAYWTQTVDMELYLLYDGGLLQIAFVVVVIQLGLYFQLLYEVMVPRSRLLLIQQCCKVLGFAFLIQALSGLADWMLQLPKWTMIYGSLLALAALPLWRMGYAALASRAVPVRRILFLGDSPLVRDIAIQLDRHPDQGVRVMGYLDADSELAVVPRLGRVEDLDEVLHTHSPDRIVTGLRRDKARLPTRLLLNLQLSGIQIEEAEAVYETMTGRISARDLEPAQLLFSSTFDPSAGDETSRRLYSLFVSLVATIVVSPILALAALLIRASSRGPILLRRKSIGSGGVPFNLYRFRVMSTGGTSEPPALTWVGRWLRRLRLEGLPQLFNIIRGDMSLVGPQPERPEFAAILEAEIPFYRQRYIVKPGITGWAQINFKGHTDVEDAIMKLEYDLYYIKNMSAALDAYILLHSLLGT